MHAVTARIDAFLADVRNMPTFVAGVATDPKRGREVIEGLERSLLAIDRLANDDPALVEIYDEIVATMARRDLATKEKLSALGKLFLRACDTMKKTRVN
jgi:hypothetical protein